ncbi:MAG: outer membrane protein insertion porin family [Gemmatimonadaceae bacterium]|jgi:outer membrane protein insertion porin family/translocation and assembly module TamA|nr:outer membrane protein insertion porin family [Gemmatimonadaceae bacterium]
MRLVFEGNHAFSDAELAKTIVTTPSAWARRYLYLPFTVKHCLDRTELPNDRARLIIFYRRRGYPKVTVDTVVKSIGKGAVEVRFKINEGPPIILRSFVLRGVDSVPEKPQVIRGLPVHQNGRFDRFAIDAAADTVRERLHNNGYPRADAINSFSVSDSTLSAWDTLTVTPGPRTRIGAIKIQVTPVGEKKQQIPTRIVRRIMGLDSGRLFREDEVVDAQRALYQTEAYQHVSITPDSSRDSLVTLYANLAEAPMHAARVGAGYGTLDCFRVTSEYTDYNFLNGARRLDLNARVSKIGIGRPLSGAPGFCPTAKKDVFSNLLSYYVGATLRQPVFFGLRTVPTLTVYSQSVSEYNAYRRTTAIGGVASVVWRSITRTPVNLSYSMDLGRTEAQPALFCALFNLCDAEERRRVEKTQRLAILSLSATRDNSNSLLSPTRGSIIRVEARHSSPFILSDTALQFNKFVGDASRYISAGGGNVLALRIRGGVVYGRSLGSATGFIPPSERLYAGGPTTVRGFAQNELGSAIYIASTPFLIVPPSASGQPDTVVRDTSGIQRRVVPVGGNSLVVANVELRLRSPIIPELLQLTLFTDAGEVWNRGSTSALGGVKLKVTPGIQMTAFSPVGPVRVAVGYNPYRRPTGPLYYEATNVPGAPLLCVSPGNDVPTHFSSPDPKTGAITITQDVTANGCPGTYLPPKDNRFRSKLTFSFAIGQAF